MQWHEVKLQKASYIGDYKLHIRYNNSLEADVDFSDLLTHPFYLRLQDKVFFAQAHIDSECAILVWPEDIDLAPELLFERTMNAAAQQNGK